MLLVNPDTREGKILAFNQTFQDYVYQRWMKSGAVAKIEKRKRIFREPKKSGSCDNVLKKYTDAIKYPSSETNGALLMSVVGGKMSEGNAVLLFFKFDLVLNFIISISLFIAYYISPSMKIHRNWRLLRIL